MGVSKKLRPSEAGILLGPKGVPILSLMHFTRCDR